MTSVPVEGHRIKSVIAWAAVFSALVLVATIFDDFGVTWDEPYHDNYGRLLLAYYATWFDAREALSYHNLWLYGGAFDLPVAILKRILPFGAYETAHLATAMTGLLGALGAVRIATLVAGSRAGWFAGVLLLAMPSWFGHMFFNPKDIPFGTGMTWTLFYAMRFLRDAPNVGWPVVAGLGVSLGLTLGIRISGVISLIYIALGAMAWMAWRLRSSSRRAALGAGWRVGSTRLVPGLVVAYAVMLAFWPWAQQSPFVRPFQALTIFSNSPWDLDVLLAGRLVNSLHLPASYLPIYFGVKLPEIVLVLLPLGAWALGEQMLAGWRRMDWRSVAPAYLLATAVVFPFAFFVAFRPVTYDEIRHFLFVLPPIAVAAACGLDFAFSRLERLQPLVVSLRIVIAGALVWQVVIMARLHPAQYVYYNAFAGGTGGAAGRYELDYWGNSYREAVERLATIVAREPRDAAASFRVMVCSAGTSAAYFFPPGMTLARDEYEADFYIASTRLRCDEEYEGDVAAVVQRDGAVLTVVKDRRALRAAGRERLGARIRRTGTERQHPGIPLDSRGTP